MAKYKITVRRQVVEEATSIRDMTDVEDSDLLGSEVLALYQTIEEIESGDGSIEWDYITDPIVSYKIEQVQEDE